MSKPGILLLGLLIALAGCLLPPGNRKPYRPPAASAVQSPKSNPPPQKSAPVVPAPRPAPPAAAPAAAPPAVAATNTARPRTNAYAETWISLARWVRENRLGTLRQVNSAWAPTYALVTDSGMLFLQADSRLARWDGLELHLGFNPQMINGQPFVHALDLKKNIEPLASAPTVPAKTNRIVVLDPGHGGPSTGATSVLDGENEKEFTLDWARRAASLLASNGWQVFLTRTNDVDVSLSNRVAFAEERKAGLFISLHFNSAAPSQEQSGVETYCLTPAGMPSTLTRGYEDDLSLVFPNNAFDAENLQYAHRLHRSLVRVAGRDRGLRHARFLGVLRGQNRPAVLVEGGYLSNPHEAERIAEPEYRQLLAEALARALGPDPAVRMLAASNRPAAGSGTNGLAGTNGISGTNMTNAISGTNAAPTGNGVGSPAPRTNSAPLR